MECVILAMKLCKDYPATPHSGVIARLAQGRGEVAR